MCGRIGFLMAVALALGHLAVPNAHATSLPCLATAVVAQPADYPAPDEGISRDFFSALGGGLGNILGAVYGPVVGLDPITGSLVGGALGAVAGTLANRAFIGPYGSPIYLPPLPLRPIWWLPMPR